jgi:plasmid maintenance system antidote protein VapI
MAATYTYQPDYAVPPGETLRELMDAKGLSNADLAMRTGLTKKTITQIVTGEGPISLDTASKLELVFGVPARFWNSRELAYRESLARQEATEKMSSDVAWLREVPCKELIERGLVEACADKVEMVRQVLRFFGVGTVEAWRETFLKPAAQFRGGGVAQKHPGEVAAWLRMGELRAEKIECKPFDAQGFKDALAQIRKLLDQPSSVWHPAMLKLCAEAGVAVVFVKEIPGASVSGATHWANKDKAILQLSLKYKRDDQILFSFFHEAAHILKHGKKLVFVDTLEASSDELEKEANAFAREILIPSQFNAEISRLWPRCSRRDVLSLATRARIAPGVVVGRLQYEGMDKRFLNDLKVVIEWA